MAFDWSLIGHLFLTNLSYWWLIVASIALGYIVGAIPGFNAANTIIVLLPMTFAMRPDMAMAFMVALYCSTHLGAGLPAILVSIPGTPGAAATPLDGNPMARQGRANQALAISFTSSALGGIITTLMALALMPWFAKVTQVMHSVEMIVVMLFGISLIATIAAGDTLKGLIAGFFGLMLGSIGSDPVYATPRGTFGLLQLYDGIPLIPALVGLFAISEAFLMIEGESLLTQRGLELMRQAGWKETFEGVTMTLRRWWHVTWTATIGLLVGVVPGAGAAVASFVAYQQSKAFSKTPEKYGTGHPEGLIAPESANNGVTSGTLIPTMVLGVPGGETAAIMMIVMQYHGIVLGPSLFIRNPDMAYTPFVTMTVTYALMIFTVLPLARYASKVTIVPTLYMAPIILTFTLVGSYVPRDYTFDMGLALVFGVIGYIARKTGYHTAAILIGVLLGPLMERYFLVALRLSQGDVMVLFSSTLGNVLWVALVASIALPYFMEWRRKRRNQAATT